MRFLTFSTPILILTLIFSISNPTHVSGQCLQAQKDLLLELKNSLIYDFSISTKLVQWDESIDCCKWNGVKCDNKGRVFTLDLSKEPISDGINNSSSSLFKLEFLQNLNLAENSFSNIELPSGFGNLKSLSYLNLSNSGFSGQIPLDFSKLTRLVVLDLSSTPPSFQLQNPDLEKVIHSFSRLRELYLDGVNISAQGSVWCNAISASLPDLRVLSLSNAYLTGPFDSSLAKLKSLSAIRLDGNAFSSPLPKFFADFPNLRVLTMSACDLTGVVPAKLFQIKTLESIDLGNNRDLEGYLPEFPVNGALNNLVLSYTKFSGNVSESIGHLKMLSNLDLRACLFSGRIPSSIRNLTQLDYFDLSANNFVGPTPSFAFLKNLRVINLRGNGLTGQIHDSHWEGLENLDFIDLSDNNLEGEIPQSLFGLPSLEVLRLSNNSFSGSIRGAPKSSSPLAVIELDNNHLDGQIPRFFFKLQNISSVGLSSNKFNGTLELTGFQKLNDLVSLDLSNNNLSVRVNQDVPISSLFPRLGTIRLVSCRLENFPLLTNLSNLMMIDLSVNQIHGEIPSWLWEVGNGFLRFLNLSHNHFTSLQEPYDFRSIHYLDLHSNMLGGQIPLTPTPAVFIDFSSNNFSSPLPTDVGNFLVRVVLFSVSNNRIIGTIPPSLCNASNVNRDMGTITSLQILDLSNNSFHGEIPSCLLQQPEISVLNLGRNNLGGYIPDTFPVNCTLQTLDLSWNVLQGKVPKSLERCTNLEVLNLGNNELNDVFPCWLKSLPKLRVLVLRFNKFHGNISCLRDTKTWTDLQIINVASNNLNGFVPENLFRNLESMMNDEDGLDHLRFVFQPVSDIYYQDSVMVTLKGQDAQIDKILNIFTSMDFSNNKFSGAIPETLGELKALYVLNFSRNSLTGHIPPSIGNLQKLESLDLSLNKLGGEIPNEIASLTFLSFLNLSYNQLVGRIPPGSQMQTYSESSFIGNPGLCGFPLNKTCSGSKPPPIPEQESKEKSTVADNGIFVSAAIGFLVGLGFIFGPIVASERWRRCYNRNLNKFVLLVLHRQENGLENEDW